MKCNSALVYYKKKTKSGKPRVFASISPAHYKEKGYWEYFKNNNHSKEELNFDGYSYCSGNFYFSSILRQPT